MLLDFSSFPLTPARQNPLWRKGSPDTQMKVYSKLLACTTISRHTNKKGNFLEKPAVAMCAGIIMAYLSTERDFSACKHHRTHTRVLQQLIPYTAAAESVFYASGAKRWGRSSHRNGRLPGAHKNETHRERDRYRDASKTILHAARGLIAHTLARPQRPVGVIFINGNNPRRCIYGRLWCIDKNVTW
jgi:hypothetical protein